MRKFLTVIAGTIITLAPLSALAQTTPLTLTGNPNTTVPGGLSSCFDHYTFGSVNAVIDPTLQTVSAGSPIGFRGTLTNNNRYPITDATVYIKIFMDRPDGNLVNGSDVVDFFPVAQHVDLKASSTIPLNGEWKVPMDAVAGDYRIATYIVSNDRFEMSGLVFTDDILGSSQNFSVVSDVKGGVRFDKDSVTVGGQPFGFASFPPRVAATGNVPVVINVENTSDEPFKGSVTWKLYYWDQVEESHLLDTQTDDVKIHPEGTTTLSYTVKDTAHTVYYIQGEIDSPNGSKSIVGIRFVNTQVNEPRINFATVDGSTAVACMHSTSNNDASSTEVSITVTRAGPFAWFMRLLGLGTLAHAEYNGTVPSTIYALTTPLSHEASSYGLHVELSQNGKHIDTFDTAYSCTLLGTSCSGGVVTTILIPIAVILLIIGIILVVVHRRRHHSNPAVATHI